MLTPYIFCVQTLRQGSKGDGRLARPPRYKQMVDASRDEACLAVRLYNDPTEPRSFEGFVVHMHLAWL